MSNFITGLFTLLAALSSIWLKDHLDRKKSAEATRKQKAVEAYSLTGKLMYSLNTLKLICSNLVLDKNYSYTNLYRNNPNTSSDILEKLELLVIENFYDIKTRKELLEVEKIINSYNQYLYKIITTIHNQDFQLDNDGFTKETNKLDQILVQSCHNLRSSLDDNYINKAAPHITFYSLLESAKEHIKFFFTK